MATYYIDPNSPSNGDGLTPNTPKNTWTGISLNTGNVYLQKAGTTFTGIPNIGTGGITIGSYGDGPRPRVVTTGSFWSITGADLLFKDFEVTGPTAGLLISNSGFVADNLDVHDILDSNGFGISFNTSGSGTIKNSSIYTIGNDAIEIRAGAGTVIVDNVDSWDVSKSGAGGDNIGGANGGTYNLLVNNCRFTKTDAYKQNIMSGTSGYVKVYNSVLKNLGGGGTFSCQGASLYELIGCDVYGNGANSGPYANGATGTTITDANIYGNRIVMDNNIQYCLQADSDNSGTINIYNNTLIKSGTSGRVYDITSNSTGTVNFYNNIVSGGQYSMYHQGTVTLNADRNIYAPGAQFVYGGLVKSTFALWKAAAAGLDANSLQVDPLLTSDYLLLPTSPALALGNKWWTNARPKGFLGEPYPDLGLDCGFAQSIYHIFHPVNL